MGVSGVGGTTASFSPARRDLGSGVVGFRVPQRFGATGISLLRAGLGPTSEEYWLEAMGAMKALEDLQSKRGGKMLMSSLNLTTPGPTLFRENLLRFYRQLEFTSPYIPTCYFIREGNQLAHDAHPNRAGHRILTSHYVHVLAKLGWIPESESLPALDPRLSLNTSPTPDPERLRSFQLHAIADLKSRLDFSDLDKVDLQSMLGGFLPGVRAGLKYTLKNPPFGTLRTMFLLRNDGDASEAYVTIQVPPKVELFPLHVSLYVQGELGDSLTVESAATKTNFTLRAPIPESKRGDPVIELKLLADRYWSEIDRRDEGMRSYRLIEAGLE